MYSRRVHSEIDAAGSRAISEQADVSDPAAVRHPFDAGEKAFGRPDVVVPNAGIVRLIKPLRNGPSSVG